MKLARIYSENNARAAGIGNDEKTKMEQDNFDRKELQAWWDAHNCYDDNKNSSFRIGTPADIKKALDYAPWYFKKGGSLPMLKIEKDKEDKKYAENKDNKKNEIKIFVVNSIKTTLARKCLDSPNLDDDKSYFDMEARETHHSIIIRFFYSFGLG